MNAVLLGADFLRKSSEELPSQYQSTFYNSPIFRLAKNFFHVNIVTRRISAKKWKGTEMKIKLSFGWSLFAIGFATVAHAGIYSGGPAYPGNTTGAAITCRVFNAGLTNANITLRQIIDNTGTVATLTSDSCTTVLGPSKSCAFSTTSGGNFAFSCRLYSSSPDDNLRGAIEINAPSGSVHLPLTK